MAKNSTAFDRGFQVTRVTDSSLLIEVRAHSSEYMFSFVQAKSTSILTKFYAYKTMLSHTPQLTNTNIHTQTAKNFNELQIQKTLCRVLMWYSDISARI